MRKQQTKTIDGMTFTVQQLPAMRAQRLKPRIVSILAGPAAKIGTVLGGARRLEDLDLGALAGAFDALAGKLSPDEYEAVTRELLETTLVQQGPNLIPLLPVFDDIMAGRTLTVDKLLLFAVEVNYGDFFDALRGAFGRTLAESLSKESTISSTSGQSSVS